jgi:hypothetical protein
VQLGHPETGGPGTAGRMPSGSGIRWRHLRIRGCPNTRLRASFFHLPS